MDDNKQENSFFSDYDTKTRAFKFAFVFLLALMLSYLQSLYFWSQFKLTPAEFIGANLPAFLLYYFPSLILAGFSYAIYRNEKTFFTSWVVTMFLIHFFLHTGEMFGLMKRGI